MCSFHFIYLALAPTGWVQILSVFAIVLMLRYVSIYLTEGEMSMNRTTCLKLLLSTVFESLWAMSVSLITNITFAMLTGVAVGAK